MLRLSNLESLLSVNPGTAMLNLRAVIRCIRSSFEKLMILCTISQLFDCNSKINRLIAITILLLYCHWSRNEKKRVKLNLSHIYEYTNIILIFFLFALFVPVSMEAKEKKEKQ